MVKKKNTYAEKHRQDEDLSSWATENADLLEIFKQPYNFEKIFLSLPYQRQLDFLRTLKAIQNGQFNTISPQDKSSLEFAANEFFQKIQWMTETSYDEGRGFYPLANDEKRIVRMECYGSINQRQSHQLSTCYKFFVAKAAAMKSQKRYKFKEYDLTKSPMWRVFNQFETFRAIAPKVRKYFYDNNINPEVLGVMSVNDFCDVIYNAYVTNPDHNQARFLKKPRKNQFVINFMRHCGTEFYNHLLQQGIDERAAFSLCHIMRRYGICDTSSLTIMETHFTDRILSDLKEQKYDIRSFKVGDKIPVAFINEMIDKDMEHLLQARYNNGLPLSKSVLPKYEVHHADGVQFAHSSSGGKLHYDRYLAQVNYPNSLMLVESDMHHLYFHGYDSVIRVGHDTECYYSRINSDNPHMAMIDGFNSQNQIFCDMEDNAEFRRREQEDRKNVVNYYEMALARLNNIQNISQKYGIHYSVSQLNQEISELQKSIGLNNNLSEDILKSLNSWVRSIKKTRKINRLMQMKANKGRN